MEPLIHFLVPLLLLVFLFPKLDKKIAVGLSLLTQLPDFDIFVVHDLHRALFHNLFFVVIVALIVAYFLGKTGFFVSLYYLISHLIFDSAEAGNALFWPLYNNLLGFKFAIMMQPKFEIILDFFSMPFNPGINAGEICILCQQGSLILVLAGIVLIAKCYTLWKNSY